MANGGRQINAHAIQQVEAYNPALKQHFPLKKINMCKSSVNSKGR